MCELLTSSESTPDARVGRPVLTCSDPSSHLLMQYRELYADKKYVPLDLRPKKTRAIRRRLTPEQVCHRVSFWKHFQSRVYLSSIMIGYCGVFGQ